MTAKRVTSSDRTSDEEDEGTDIDSSAKVLRLMMQQLTRINNCIERYRRGYRDTTS